MVVAARLNRTMTGWANYFRLGRVKAYRAVGSHACQRLRRRASNIDLAAIVCVWRLSQGRKLHVQAQRCCLAEGEPTAKAAAGREDPGSGFS